MYTADHKDRVAELRDIPQSSVGAPCPLILASERELIVAYFTQQPVPDWDGKSVRVVGPESQGEPAALIRFVRFEASLFGPPNDEAFAGHPLAKRGLHPHGAFEIIDSSWVRQLEKMNAVHPHHQPDRYKSYRQFVLAFHDSTFECIAEGYVSQRATGPLTQVVADAARGLVS
jgi:hypothetical protein